MIPGGGWGSQTKQEEMCGQQGVTVATRTPQGFLKAVACLSNGSYVMGTGRLRGKGGLSRLGLSNFANRNTCYPVNPEFQICNKVFFFGVSLSHAICATHLYFK